MPGRFALLIGNSEYEDPSLPRLEAPAQDAEDLAGVLQNREIGGFDEVTRLLDESAPSIQRHIARFLRRRKSDDFLLLYFSGHGIRDDAGRLYLAATDTEHEILSATAVPARFITDALDSSASKRQVLILDCCHSGAFAKGGEGTSVGIRERFEGTGYGRVVITASDAFQSAWEGDKLIGDIEKSVFTHYLIEGLKTGLADAKRDGIITLEEWFNYAYESVIGRTSKQTPMMWSYKRTGELTIAKNPNWIVKPELMIEYADYPRPVVEDIARLRRRMMEVRLPSKVADYNLLIASWHISEFGKVHKAWTENPGKPKRNLRALAIIAEIIQRFDVIAVQGIEQDASGLKTLLERFMGPNWGFIITDDTNNRQGNAERLAFVYDKRRVQPTRLVGEIVLPTVHEDVPANLFVRAPFIVGFQVGGQGFALLTVHIKYSESQEQRLIANRALIERVVAEIRQQAGPREDEERNLIVLGDLDIYEHGDNALLQTLVSVGLFVPGQIAEMKATYGTKRKHCDQIGWFMGDVRWTYTERAGPIDFVGAVYQELDLHQMSRRVSDHLPLWVEFIIDRSAEQMALTLGIDPAMPDPLGVVPD